MHLAVTNINYTMEALDNVCLIAPQLHILITIKILYATQSTSMTYSLRC